MIHYNPNDQPPLQSRHPNVQPLFAKFWSSFVQNHPSNLATPSIQPPLQFSLSHPLCRFFLEMSPSNLTRSTEKLPTGRQIWHGMVLHIINCQQFVLFKFQKCRKKNAKNTKPCHWLRNKQSLKSPGKTGAGEVWGGRFNVNKQTIGNILKQKDQILEDLAKNLNPDRKRTLHAARHDELNEKVYQLFVSCSQLTALKRSRRLLCIIFYH